MDTAFFYALGKSPGFTIAAVLTLTLAMLLLGLVATWIPAQRALATDPLVLLREE